MLLLGRKGSPLKGGILKGSLLKGSLLKGGLLKGGQLKGGLLMSAALLLAVSSGCQSPDRLTVIDPGIQDDGHQPAVNPGSIRSSGRELTVVGESPGQGAKELHVDRTRRIPSSHIEAWLSEDEVRVTTTVKVKEATKTEEPEYAYTAAVVNLSTGACSELANPDRLPASQTVKEQASPDGKFSFIQQWRDKYTADNFIKNMDTGEMIPVTGSNYMEIGGWLDSDTYALAAGSQDGKGDIRLIGTDGTYETLSIKDNDVEYYQQFGASKGRIYYTDVRHTLKVVEPGQTKPVNLIDNVWSFEISPDSEYIAVATAGKSGGGAGSELLIYDASGTLQGNLIGKGDTVSYLSWSPDSSKLAFDVYSENESGMNGVYVFDATSGKVTWMAPYYSSIHPAAHPVYPLSWSPSGNRLAITTEDPEALIETQVIDFS